MITYYPVQYHRAHVFLRVCLANHVKMIINRVVRKPPDSNQTSGEIHFRYPSLFGSEPKVITAIRPRVDYNNS